MKNKRKRPEKPRQRGGRSEKKGTLNVGRLRLAARAAVLGVGAAGVVDGVRIDGHRFGAVVRLVDAHQPVGQLEHVRPTRPKRRNTSHHRESGQQPSNSKGKGEPERDDDELGVARALPDVVADDGDVLEVERGVDLVHDVQRRGLVVVQRKHLQGHTDVSKVALCPN